MKRARSAGPKVDATTNFNLALEFHDLLVGACGNRKVIQLHRPPTGLSRRERMARRLRTLRGRAIYRLRMFTAEPVNGQLKQAMGFRQFLLRGLEKVRGEGALLCMAFNLRKLWSAAYG